MAEDTAVLEQGTAAVEEAPPLEATPPETEVPDAPETEDAPDTPETDEGQEEPVTEDDEKSLLEDKRVKWLLDRKEESHRRQIEALKNQVATEKQAEQAHAQELARDARYLQARAQASDTSRRETFGSLMAVIKNSIEAGEMPDPQIVGQHVGRMGNDLAVMFTDQLVEELNTSLSEAFPDYGVPPQLMSRFAAAQANHNHKAMLKVFLDGWADAAYQKGQTAERTATAKAQSEREKAAAQTKKLRDAESARSGQKNATNVGGSAPLAGRKFASVQELDAYISENPDVLPRGPSSRAVYNQMAAGLPYTR